MIKEIQSFKPGDKLFVVTVTSYNNRPYDNYKIEEATVIEYKAGIQTLFYKTKSYKRLFYPSGGTWTERFLFETKKEAENYVTKQKILNHYIEMDTLLIEESKAKQFLHNFKHRLKYRQRKIRKLKEKLNDNAKHV